MNKLLKSAWSLLLGAALLAAAMPAAAQETEEEAVSGRELLAGCEQNAVPGHPNQYCMQYVFGLIQTVLMLQQMDKAQEQLFCIDPNSVSLEKVTSDVVSWLQKSRDRLDEDAYVLVSEALHKHYPCNKM